MRHHQSTSNTEGGVKNNTMNKKPYLFHSTLIEYVIHTKSKPY